MIWESGIHPTAIISQGAKLGQNVTVGPWSIIGPHVEIGDDCRIHSHVTIDGHTTIGKNNEFHPYCLIGAPPQDLTYKGEPTKVVIGDNNIFREYTNVHRATMKENQVTKIGSNCFIMGQTHIAHDCVLGDYVIVANNADIAGHAKIGDRVYFGGVCSVSPFCKVGRGTFIGGASAIDKDVPMFCTAIGNRIKLKGINIVGLRRNGFDKKVISQLVDFYRKMEDSQLSPRSFVSQPNVQEEYGNNELIQEMIDFIKESKGGIAPFIS